MGLELDYCNWKNVGAARNASMAHGLLDTLYTDKVVFPVDLEYQMRNKGGRE